MRKLILLLSIVATLCSCSSTPEEGAVIIQETQAKNPVADEYNNPLLQKTIEDLTVEYLYRVYNIVDDYSPEYIDEATTPEEMIASVYDNNIRCNIKDQVVTKFTFINKGEADVIVVATADFTSKSIESGEYYIPITVNCKKKNLAWVVADSSLGTFMPTSDWSLKQNQTSGQYEFVCKEEN